MTKPQLIRLIHIAKSQFKLDDDTYRQLLVNIAGKDSCTKMTLSQLMDVYQSFKGKGFKRSFKNTKKRVRLNSDGRARVGEIQKIRAIWITMHQQQFITDGSEKALDSYVKSMTKKYNGGLGVETVGWLDDVLACKVLESLKQWHKRVMLKKLNIHASMIGGYDDVCDAYAEVIA